MCWGSPKTTPRPIDFLGTHRMHIAVFTAKICHSKKTQSKNSKGAKSGRNDMQTPRVLPVGPPSTKP